MDARVDLTPLLEAFGVPATVTRPSPDDDAIATTVIWLPPLEEVAPFGTDIRRAQPRQLLAIPRGDVPTMPRGTVVVAPELEAGENKTWRVDEIVQSAEVDLWRVAVVAIG